MQYVLQEEPVLRELVPSGAIQVNTKPRVLELYRSLGTTLSVGWAREDLPMIHVFFQAEPGQRVKFELSDHWPCKVCKDHGYTIEDFKAQLEPALLAGPVS